VSSRESRVTGHAGHGSKKCDPLSSLGRRPCPRLTLDGSQGRSPGRSTGPDLGSG